MKSITLIKLLVMVLSLMCVGLVLLSGMNRTTASVSNLEGMYANPLAYAERFQ